MFLTFTCPHLLFDYSPHPHLLVKSSDHTRFSLYLSTPALLCLCGSTCVGVESSSPSSGLHLIEHDVLYVSIHYLSFALTSPHFGEGALRRTTSGFDLPPVIGAWSARSCLLDILFTCPLPLFVQRSCTQNPRAELCFGSATQYENCPEVWAHSTPRWSFGLCEASCVAQRMVGEDFDFDIVDDGVEDGGGLIVQGESCSFSLRLRAFLVFLHSLCMNMCTVSGERPCTQSCRGVLSLQGGCGHVFREPQSLNPRPRARGPMLPYN